MKTIAKFDKVDRNNRTPLSEMGINSTIYRAYRDSKESGAEYINFAEVIWDYDTAEIYKFCKEEGIEYITISSTFSSLTERLWDLTQYGCKIEGMIKVPMRWTDYDPELRQVVQAKAPALLIKIN